MSIDEVFSFIHLSDTHLPASREESVNGVKPCLKLEETLSSISRLKFKSRFAIITGDLARNGEIEEYILLKEYVEELEELDIPVFLVLGNHDNRDNFRAVFQTENENGLVYYVKDIGRVRLIVLDTLIPRRHIGGFTGGQLEWLKNVLHNNPSQPTIIAFHHPVFRSWVKLLEGLFPSDQRRQFYQIIEDYNVLAVLNGHLHHNLTTIYNGVLHIQAGSTYNELYYNREEYWTKNALSYNQIIYQNSRLYVKTLSLPYDGRILSRGSLEIFLE